MDSIGVLVVAYQDFIHSRFGLQPANLEVSSKRSKEREPSVNGFVDIAWHLHHLRRPITNANLKTNLTYLWPRIRYFHPLLWLGVFLNFQELKEFYTWKLQMVAVGSMAQVPFWHLNSRLTTQHEEPIIRSFQQNTRPFCLQKKTLFHQTFESLKWGISGRHFFFWRLK